jgi:catechol 2,3-dioxygenase-like lactoylglutathione lyase family enzyme
MESIGLVSPAVTFEQELEDPDGLRLRLYPGPQAALRDVVAFGNPDLYAGLVAEDAPISFAAPSEETALIGAGITHHIAFRCKTDEDQAVWLARLAEIGLRPTPVQDRKYFHSIYFRMPDGILVEIATDGPGFFVDEAPTRLGQLLALPPWLEPERQTLERELAPIV